MAERRERSLLATLLLVELAAILAGLASLTYRGRSARTSQGIP